MSNLIFQLEEDHEFKEFLSVHQRRDQAPTWANDTVQTSAAVGLQQKSQSKKDVSDDYLNFDSDDSDVAEEEDEPAEDDDDDDAEDDDDGDGEGW